MDQPHIARYCGYLVPGLVFAALSILKPIYIMCEVLSRFFNFANPMVGNCFGAILTASKTLTDCI